MLRGDLPDVLCFILHDLRGGLGLNPKIIIYIAFIAATFVTAASANELDIKTLNIPGVSALKAADILVDRPVEPRATYVIVALGKGPEGSVVSINTRYSHASGWVLHRACSEMR